MNLKQHKIRQQVSLSLSLILGTVFCFSAISKILDFHEFTLTINTLLKQFKEYSVLIAIIVLLIELVLGMFLLKRKFLQFIIPMLITLVLLFIALLTYNILMGNSTACNCFGFISNSYSIKIQLLIDILILNLLIILFYLHNERVNLSYFRSNKNNWLIAITFYSFVNFGLIQIAIVPEESNSKFSNDFIEEYINITNIKNGHNNSIKIFLILSFNDFNCPLCFDSFLEITDTLNNLVNKYEIGYLFAKDLNDSSLTDIRVKEWSRIVGIQNPTYLISQETFSKYAQKSSIIIFDEEEVLKFKESFPLSDTKKTRNI